MHHERGKLIEELFKKVTSVKLKFSNVVDKKNLAAVLYRLQLSSASPAAHLTLHNMAASSLFFENDTT